MTGHDDDTGPADARSRLVSTFDRANPFASRVVGAVVAIALVALALRLYALGYRVMHYDEGRVAYWILEQQRLGEWRYRYIIHGPFVQHVNHYLFSWFGHSDFVARFPVAVVGALLPLSALLFRRHLLDREVVALAALFTLNPILLYYSRFMRSDVLVAAFSVVAFGFLVRLWDTRRVRYLYLAVALLAFGFASKENAIVYWLCWAGMVGAVGGLELLYPRRFDSRGSYVAAGRETARRWLAWFASPASRSWVVHGVVALALFGLLTVFFFAPRSSSAASTGLWHSPPTATIDATIAALETGFDHWLGSGSGPPGCLGTPEEEPFLDRYLCNVGRELNVVALGAPVLGVLSLVGYASEFASDRPRLLVEGAFYWGIASLLGYPLGTDIMYPGWLPIHALVALAIPAGVGLVLVVRYAREASAEGERLDTALAVVLVGVVVVGMVGPAVQYAYLAPQSGQEGQANVIQYAQPSGHMQDELALLNELGEADDGLDVVVYGDTLVDGQESAARKPACMVWFNPSLPLSYYLYQSDADVSCAKTEGEFASLTGTETPAVVIAVEREADEVRDRLGSDYVSASYGLRLWSGPGNTAVFFVHEDVAPDDLLAERSTS